jgi:hypothetical protein
MELELERIEALQIEAGEAGDEKLVATCRRALNGEKQAMETCDRILRDAAAQE